MADLVNISIPNAFATAVLGYGVVFLGLVLLMFVLQIMGKIMHREAPAAPTAGLAAGEVIKSPMPGNVLKLLVSQGQQVKEGDVLIILEAMKMENEIVATKSGSVAQILVTKGQVVETGSPLIVIA